MILKSFQLTVCICLVNSEHFIKIVPLDYVKIVVKYLSGKIIGTMI